jgi:hypothetical protein
VILKVFESWAQALEVLGVWLGAVATFSAVLVALYIANRDTRQRLKITARPMLEVSVGDGRPKPIFHISATNLGNRPITITHLGAQGFRKMPTYILTVGMPDSWPIPTTLNDGQIAHWRFPEITPNDESWYRAFALDLSKMNPVKRWLSLRTFRFLIVTSLGKTFFSKPSLEFRKKVLEQINLGATP